MWFVNFVWFYRHAFKRPAFEEQHQMKTCKIIYFEKCFFKPYVEQAIKFDSGLSIPIRISWYVTAEEVISYFLGPSTKAILKIWTEHLWYRRASELVTVYVSYHFLLVVPIAPKIDNTAKNASNSSVFTRTVHHQPRYTRADTSLGPVRIGPILVCVGIRCSASALEDKYGPDPKWYRFEHVGSGAGGLSSNYRWLRREEIARNAACMIWLLCLNITFLLFLVSQNSGRDCFRISFRHFKGQSIYPVKFDLKTLTLNFTSQVCVDHTS